MNRPPEDHRRGEPPRRRRPGGGNGRLRSLLWNLYKGLTVISAVIIVSYLAAKALIHPPEQLPAPPEPPGPAASQHVDVSSSGSEPSKSKEDWPDLLPLARKKDFYTVLLAATDVEGVRTDTIMVLAYDVANQRVGVVSVPRDTLTRREDGKNPKLAYGPGNVIQRREDVSHMLGIPIDRYVKVNIRGFVALVDYLKGVDFYIPCDMDYDDPDQELEIHYKKGKTHLSGQQAMEVARFRKNNDGTGYSDVGRTQTQQKLLMALAKKVLSWGNITKINDFVDIFNQHVSTDMEIGEMLYFVQKVMDQSNPLDPAEQVETVTLEGRGDSIYHGIRYCYELDPDKTLESVNRLLNPYTRNLTLREMDLVKADRYMED